MLETKFKVLMNSGYYVNADLLPKGIYYCEKPFIYMEGETIESIADKARSLQNLFGERFVNQKYIESLLECKLVEVKLTIKQ